jgi:hypothetical protein
MEACEICQLPKVVNTGTKGLKGKETVGVLMVKSSVTNSKACVDLREPCGLINSHSLMWLFNTVTVK